MWLLVPIKAYDLAKQRLASLLSPAERSGLAAAMAADVLDVVCTVPQVERVIVCSGDPNVAQLARERGAVFLQESGSVRNLAQSVNCAAMRLADEGASDIAVINGDLPLLTAAELDLFFAAHRAAGAHAITIAPDHRGSGTNLLAWRPLAAFSTHYGAGSFCRHCEDARECGVSLTVCKLPGAARDIDEPADLHALARDPGLEAASATRRYLAASGLLTQLAAASGRIASSDRWQERATVE